MFYIYITSLMPSRRFKVRKFRKGKKGKGKSSPIKSFLSMARKCRLPHNAAITTSLANFPLNKLVRMRYTQVVNFVYDGAVSADNNVIRANDIYDPDPTIGGHSAMGLNQWLQFYFRWVVVESHCTSMFTSSAQTDVDNAPVLVSFTLTDNLSIPTAITQMIEQGSTKWKQVVQSNAGTPFKLTQSYTPAKFYSKENAVDDPNLIGNGFASPTVQNAYYNAIVRTVDGSPLSNYSLTLTCDYMVLFLEPILLSQSGV